MEDINHLAAVAAAVSTFLIGGLWYSPMMFDKAWRNETGLTEEKLKNRSMGKVFGLAFLYSLVMAYNLAFFLADPSIDIAMGATYGFLTGFGWVAMGFFVIALFEAKSWKYMLINGGYMIVSFTVMGTILGAWK